MFECPESCDTTASINTSIPMPPAQFVKLRQNSILWLSSSICRSTPRIEAPVVVKPETDSKSASVKRGICPLMKNGRQPITLSSTHVSAQEMYPSRTYICAFFGLSFDDISPSARHTAEISPKYI